MPDPKPLPIFGERGYQRKTCPKCGGFYWSKDGHAQACGDTPCVEYTFIGNPSIKKKMDLDTMREAYLSFFDKDHTRVGRNPVVARWRDDVFLVNASIYDFQPHVTSGEVPPPANPLVISQPCIRMTDLDSVGRSGRHLSNFEMMAHHAFNYPDKEVYWDNDCVRYCMDLLNKLGVDEHLVVYKENPWVGGGNAGHALEVMVDGLELATLVFMNLRADPNGTVTVKGQKFNPMDIRIVDTGYGLERFVWASQGTPTIYDSLYPEVLKKVFDMASVEPIAEKYPELGMEWAKASGIVNMDATSNLNELKGELVKRLNSKGQKITIEKLTEIMTPVEQVYSIVDHARCLALMLSDELIPSNVKAGYLVRLVLRKALRHIEELGLKVELADLVMMHKENMKGIMDLSQSEDFIRKVLALETERYKETASKAKKLVEKNLGALKEGSKKGYKALITLYDTHGLHPSLVKKAAQELGTDIEVPDAFEAMVAEQHSSSTPEEAKEIAVPKWILDIRTKVEAQNLPETKTVYYEQVHGTEFDAVVLFADGETVVLDQTMFYPEGGGQPSDRGTLVQSQTSLSVTEVQKLGKLILHRVEGRMPKVGTLVKGRIDRTRRLAHMRHHTGTHVVLASARQVLGPHVWQAGAQKGAEEARIDISHFARITEEEKRKIEFLANEVVLKAVPIEKIMLRREEAEKRYGFRLYQGGAPTSRNIRIVRIGDFDVQGCGGTHLDNTGEIGLIKIKKTERIQDGVVRIEFSAGIAAVKNIQKLETLLEDSSSILSVPADQLPKTIQRFFDEWKSLSKEVKELRMGALDPDTLLSKAQTVGKVKFVAARVDLGMDQMIGAAKDITDKEPSVVVLVCSPEGLGAQVVIARSQSIELDVREIIKEVAKILGGKGGGKPFMAQGGGPNSAKAPEALEKAKALVLKALGGK
jgi:alanyl-tRNA synthetase